VCIVVVVLCVILVVLCLLLWFSCVCCCSYLVCIVVVVLCLLLVVLCLLLVVLCVLLVVLCVFLSSYVYLLYYVCIAVFTLDAGLLARSHYSEGPATGQLDTGLSWFPCVYKQTAEMVPNIPSCHFMLLM